MAGLLLDVNYLLRFRRRHGRRRPGVSGVAHA